MFGLFKRSARSASSRPAPARKTGSFRPTLEALEDRLALSTTVTGQGSIASVDKTYNLSPDGLLWSLSANGYQVQRIATGVHSVSLGHDAAGRDELWYTANNGMLKEYTPATGFYSYTGGYMKSIQAGVDEVFALGFDNHLYQFNNRAYIDRFGPEGRWSDLGAGCGGFLSLSVGEAATRSSQNGVSTDDEVWAVDAHSYVWRFNEQVHLHNEKHWYDPSSWNNQEYYTMDAHATQTSARALDVEAGHGLAFVIGLDGVLYTGTDANVWTAPRDRSGRTLGNVRSITLAQGDPANTAWVLTTGDELIHYGTGWTGSAYGASWEDTGRRFREVEAGQNGDLYGVGLDGHFYQGQFTTWGGSPWGNFASLYQPVGYAGQGIESLTVGRDAYGRDEVWLTATTGTLFRDLHWGAGLDCYEDTHAYLFS